MGVARIFKLTCRSWRRGCQSCTKNYL